MVSGNTHREGRWCLCVKQSDVATWGFHLVPNDKHRSQGLGTMATFVAASLLQLALVLKYVPVENFGNWGWITSSCWPNPNLLPPPPHPILPSGFPLVCSWLVSRAREIYKFTCNNTHHIFFNKHLVWLNKHMGGNWHQIEGHLILLSWQIII